MSTIVGLKRQSKHNFVKLNWATCEVAKNDKNSNNVWLLKYENNRCVVCQVEVEL